MKINKSRFKTPLSILLSLSIVAASSLTTFASLDTSEPVEATDSSFAAFQEPTGTLTVAKRDVAINNTQAKVGQTVMSGNLIRTGTDSHASVEISSVGRADYGRLTESLLTMSQKSIESSMLKCGSITLTLPAGVSGLVKVVHMQDVGVFSERKEVDVKVTRGEILVKYGQGKEKTLNSGDHKEFDNATEVSAVGDAVFSVYCHEDHLPIALILIPAAGLFIPLADKFGPSGTPPLLSTLQP
ncbi:MAG TPA: hypothetical protein VLR90_16355 [Blastocatellia bacterium]|nr:hypothetical protein [Blastocatellia bacterium]